VAGFWVRRIGGTLAPIGPEDFAALCKLPCTGEDLYVEVKRPRNGAHHRLYWTMCQRIAEAIGSEAENVSDILKISTGYCTIIKTATYGEVRLPKSISFAAMDQTGFSSFFERCVQVIQSEWGIKRADVQAAVADLLVPTEARR